jgi:hypothetical protein
VELLVARCAEFTVVMDRFLPAARKNLLNYLFTLTSWRLAGHPGPLLPHQRHPHHWLAGRPGAARGRPRPAHPVVRAAHDGSLPADRRARPDRNLQTTALVTTDGTIDWFCCHAWTPPACSPRCWTGITPGLPGSRFATLEHRPARRRSLRTPALSVQRVPILVSGKRLAISPIQSEAPLASVAVQRAIPAPTCRRMTSTRGRTDE